MREHVTTAGVAAIQHQAASLVRTAEVIRASARVQLRTSWSAGLYVLGLIQPATFLAVALLARGGSARSSPSSVALGVGLVSLWGATVWSAGGILRSERWQGTLSAIVARPTHLATVLVGKSAASTVQASALIATTVTLVAALCGDPISVAQPAYFAAALSLVFVSTSVLGLLLGCLFLLARAASRISEVLTYPIFIVGGLVIPVSVLPSWARVLSWGVPLRWGGDLLRGYAAGSGAGGREWVFLVATTAVYVVASRYAFRTVMQRARRDGTLDLY